MRKLTAIGITALLVLVMPSVAVAAGSAPYIPGAPYTSDGVYSHPVGTSVTYCATTTDPDGDYIQYVFNWGDGSSNSVTGSVPSGTQGCRSHAWSSAGSYCVTVYAQDLKEPIRGSSACRTETATAPSGAPYIPGAPYTQNGVYSHAVGTSVTYCATTTDPDGDYIQYVFNWGDGSSNSVTSSVPSGSEGCKSHTWSSAGSYCVSVYAQDLKDPVRGSSACRTETATAPSGAPYIPGAPYTQNGVYSHAVGTSVTYCAVTTDPDGDYIQYVFNWGDGSSNSVTSSVPSGSEGCKSHTWSAAGSYCVSVYAQDLKDPVRGSSACRTETATAPSGAPYIPGAPYTQNGVYTHAVGTSVSYCAVTTDPDGDSIQYVFNWGDGSSNSVSLLTPSGTERCMPHTWSAAGSYCVSVYAQDLKDPVRGSSPCRTETATEQSGAPYIPGAPYTQDGVYAHPVGTSVSYCAVTTDPNGDSIQYVFNWGDGSSNSVSLLTPSGTERCLSHAWTSAGSYCVSVYAQDLKDPVRGSSPCRTETATAAATAPPNDNFANAFNVDIFPYPDTRNTAAATDQVGEPRPCGSIGKTTWYRLAPDATFDVTASTVSSGTDFNTVLAVYRGTSMLSLTNLGCSDNVDGGQQSRVTFVALQGQTYYIQVGGASGASGTYTLNVNGGLKPIELPGAPQNAAVSAPTAGQLRLTWSAPASDGGGTIQAYRVYAGTTYPPAYAAQMSASSRGYSQYDLPFGTRYYSVSAVNEAGEGPMSSIVSGRAYAQYSVELRAFIPHAKVVDPQLPSEDGYAYWDATWYDGGVCHGAHVYNPFAKVYGWFEGDAHTDFGPANSGFRVRSMMDFRYDGANIVHIDNRAAEEHYGETHRWRKYVDTTGYTEECINQAKKVDHGWEAYLRGNAGFVLAYESPNPLVPGSPDIDGAFAGDFDASGNLQLWWVTDEFPSHAFRVVRNGVTQVTGMATDASCFTDAAVMGHSGNAEIGQGLVSQQTEQRMTIYPSSQGLSVNFPSEGCDNWG